MRGQIKISHSYLVMLNPNLERFRRQSLLFNGRFSMLGAFMTYGGKIRMTEARPRSVKDDGESSESKCVVG